MSRHRRLAAGLAGLAVGLGVTGPAHAAVSLVPTSSGLTAPAGVAETPDGALWVTDDVKGLCRVDTTREPAGLVEGTRWCGEDPDGPKSAGQAAFDPATQNFYVADGGSGSGGVWRMHWDPASGTVDRAEIIASTGADRVTALALTPTGPPALPGGPPTAEVVFATKEAPAIRLVADPAGTPGDHVAIGFATTGETSALAHLDGFLYVAEETGVGRIELGTGRAESTRPVPALPGGLPSALAADPVTHRLYAGTTNGNLVDQVDVLGPDGAVRTYAAGFTGVTALGVGAAGDLVVADDPGDAVGAIDSEGAARLWRVPLGRLDLPGAGIHAGPPAVGRSTSAAFSYRAAGAAAFECRLDAASWSSCPGLGEGSVSYEDLAEGIHVFQVRALHADPVAGAGTVARRTFVVDRTAPVAAVDLIRVSGSTAAADFSADEGAAFDCALDEGAWAPCDPVKRYAGLDPGEHVFRVRATDLAGNEGEAVSSSFEVERPRPRATDGAGTPASPVATVPASPRPAVPGVSAPAARTARPEATLLSLGRSRASRTLRLRVGLAPGTRVVRVAIHRHGRRGLGAPLAVTELPVSAAGRRELRWRLTRAQARRLGRGHVHVLVTAGPSSAALGLTRTLGLRVTRTR